ncbi:RING/U-box superfamily protein [Perilla frutescens var. hirtella]|uniref:RBR-type E3 ubiquitin transferase n=1 Tax=Perilla frutescens var. hirtella TaxID=608512 RepID=A0AAD4NYJ1_PERFH|nr:RING/U-box superfamily protein [Perilla frutescens var. hirtella]KAH6764851.1 RING/U-box superfamily protein [Perilla frutescens var. frutescens]KAH6776276.1 RING/U-box superfamily protein [Perilla frutescens var. hirtella]
MEEKRVLADNVYMGGGKTLDVKVEEDEDDFRSCCEDENELEEKEENMKVDDLDEKLDEDLVKMCFKGVSITCPGDSGSRISGIGVVMERPGCPTPVQVQKKLDFYVDELVAEYLALLDGLSVAIQHDTRRVFAFTDSEVLHNQIVNGEVVESPLLVALKQRILEQANNIETFVLKLVPANDLQKALSLAQVAVGIVAFHADGEESTESCSICCEEMLSSMMITIKCSHKFCSHCMKTYAEGKIQCSQVPIICPQLGCKYCISAPECSLFLPVTSYESLERALEEANVLKSNRIYCPYPSCSVLLDPHDCLSTRASSSSQSDNSCVECPVCQRFICVDCEVPWHSSMTCEEYQNLPLEERDASDLTLHRLARNKRWRRCEQCRRMIELTHGCYHMTCWCGNEFCYSCGADYRDGQQTCQCAFWDNDYSEEMPAYPAQELEQWAWDSFESLPTMMDAYSDQLAMIQRFLAGSFSLNDQNHYQSPPSCTDSYADAMKDLHQLPWLERFVSVISDNNYYEDYIQ